MDNLWQLRSNIDLVNMKGQQFSIYSREQI